MRNYYLVGLYIILMLNNILYAQEFNLKRISYKEGLVSAGVYDILMDEQRNVWIGADHDLCKYNGLKLEKCDRLNGWPVSSGWVYDLEIDQQNNLWIGCTDTCLFVCIDKNNRNKKFIFFHEIEEPISIIKTPQSVWVTDDTGIYEIKDYKIVSKHSFPSGFLPILKNPTATFKNNVYIASGRNGVICLNQQNGKFTSIEQQFNSSNSSLKVVNNKLYLLHEGGISLFDGERFVNFFLNPKMIQYVGAFAGINGEVWFVGSDGISVIKEGKLVYQLNAENQDFSTSNVTNGFVDPEENVWLCSGAGGVYVIRNLHFKRFANVSKKEDPVYGVLQDKNSVMWFGYSTKNQITRLFKDNNGLYYSDTIKTNITPILNTYDSIQNMVWYIGDRQTVMSVQNNTVKYYDKSKLISKYPWNPFFDATDTSIYVTGYMGLTKIKKGKFTHIHMKDSSRIFVYKGVANKNGVYLGTDIGVKRLNKKTNQIEHVPEFTKNTSVYVLIGDNRQNFWADVLNNSIIKITPGDSEKTMVKEYNLFDLYGIKGPFNMASKDEYFALRSFDMLYILDLQSVLNEKPVLLKKIDQSQGLMPEEPLYAEMYFDRQNHLWICGAFGAYKYEFVNQKKNRLPPINHITSIRVNDEELDYLKYSQDSSIDQLPINVKLPYHKNEIRFDFHAVTYKAQENVKYRTRLVGLQNDWSKPFGDNHITYNNLSPGNYTFQLISCNNDDIWSTIPIEFSFKIRPPWYQQTWFRILTIITLLALIYAIFILRTRQLQLAKKRQEKLTLAILESQEQERRKIASDLHDGVGQELSMLKMTADKEGSDKIQSKVNKIIEDVRLLSRNIHPHYFEKLGLTKAVQAMIDEQQSFGEKFWIHELNNIDGCFSAKEQIILFRVIQECVNNIIKHSKAKNVKISFEKNNSNVVINIMDNGVGFVLDQNKINSLGLSTIKERIRSLNGTVNIRSKVGSGTQTEIIIPFK